MNASMFQKAYEELSRSCMASNPQLMAVKKKFNSMRNLYLREHRVEELCRDTLELSAQLDKEGRGSLSGLLVNELGKICVNFNLPEKAEELLTVAIERCRSNQDGLHELARIIDLERIFKFTGDRQGMFRILDQKKECCKRVIENYDTYAQNFRSVIKKPTTKQEVQIQLAFTYSTLAEMIQRRKPVNAIKLYQKTLAIYEELGREKEVKHLKQKIQWLKDWNGITDI